MANIGNSRLDGFIVSEGVSAAVNVQGLTGTFIVANCTLRGSAGDGIRCSSSSPLIQDCFIEGNGANGIYCSYSSPTVERCAIAGNAASGII